MLSCQFEGHPGFLHQDSGTCVFYGITFDSILDVARYLKNVTAGPEYQGEIVRGVKVLRDPEIDMWWAEGRWWPDRRMAVKSGKRIV